MGKSRKVHLRYELPPFRRDTGSLHKLLCFHGDVDSFFRRLKRFTLADLPDNLRSFYRYGYRSFDHLCTFRGCLSNGNYYTYDERSAIEIKARIVASKLRKFSQDRFCSNFKKIFVSKQVLKWGSGFDSVESLLKSIPELMSTGVNQYEVRRGADLLERFSNEKRTEVGKTTAIKESLSTKNSTKTIAGSQIINPRYELPKKVKSKYRNEYEHCLPVLRSLKNPFSLIKFHNALARYYGATMDRLMRVQIVLGPQFLQRFPGIEKVGKDKYCFFNRSNAEDKGVAKVDKFGQPQGIKRRSSAFKSPEESQGEPASKRLKQDESYTGQDFPRSSIGSAGKKKKSKKTQSAHDGAKKKKLKKAKRKAETTRSDSEITKSALQSIKKKKAISNKSGKRKKAARCESASTVRSQGNIEATGGMSEGESGEVVQKKLKKAEQKLKEVERKLKDAETKLRRKKSLKSKRVRVKEEVTNYVESADGSPSNTSLPNDNVAPVVPMFSGFHPIPMPVFPSFETDTAVNNGWSPSVAPPMNIQNTTGTPTPKMKSGSWTNSTEGAHQSMWTNGQMQPMMTLPGFAPAPVPAQMPGFGHFPPPPMAPWFPPSFDNNPTHVLGRVMSSIVTSALERSSEPRELTNQLFDAIFGRDRQQ